jgi:hypothetical protein
LGIRQQERDMTERVFAPLIVGITGKRELNGKDDAVRAALRTAFELLDKHFKHTPKILLSALAQGTDLIAAEEAVKYADEQRAKNPPGCSWQVVAPLPMPLRLYLEDFDKAHRQRICDLRRRIKVRALPPLRRPVPGSPFDLGEPFTRDALHRQQDGNPRRTDHYEQVGLYISDQCGLLIAVMPGDEEPDKIGGTARIVYYRLRLLFDAACRDIRRRSQVLAPLPLDRPQLGPVWVIDLDALKGGDSPLNAIALWEWDSGEAPAQPAKIEPRPLTRPWNVTRLWLATALNRFNKQVQRTPETKWRENVEGRAGPDRADASSWLRRVRLALSLLQSRYKSQLTKTLSALGLVFIAAIASLEIHIEFERGFPLNLYVTLILLSLAIYVVARALRLQQHSEDYRAVAEALRVQLGWWDAGLREREDRVERTYLAATIGSLGRVRTAVRHLIDSALYVAAAPRPDPVLVRRWVDGQITFFKDRIEERHRALSLVEGLTWFLFIGAFGMAMFLVLIEREATVRKGHDLLVWVGPAHALLVWLSFVVGLFFLYQGLSILARNPSIIPPLWWVPRILSSLPAVAAGCIVAVLLVQAAIMHIHCGWRFDQYCFQPADNHAVYHLAHKLILIAMVGLIALAGALRFRADKLSQEHELFSYRDALLIFFRAADELRDIGDDTSEAAQKRRRDILIAVGREALDENEAWIRAHRLRPLEPIVGG